MAGKPHWELHETRAFPQATLLHEIDIWWPDEVGKAHLQLLLPLRLQLYATLGLSLIAR